MNVLRRELAEYVECDGSADCEAHEHIEGCFATARPHGLSGDVGEVERLRRQLAGVRDYCAGMLAAFEGDDGHWNDLPRAEELLRDVLARAAPTGGSSDSLSVIPE
jgi:hypothetical protein